MNRAEHGQEIIQCGTCGTRLERSVAEGLCPKCLAQAIFQPSPEVDAREQVQDDLGVKRIGDYELIECIARGGMGVVYRARQVSLQREVAIKVLLDPAYASPEQLQRFRSEAAVAAALRHPNIVAIHDIHESDGQRFFSMDFVAGKDLAELTRRGPLPPREAAHLVLKVADAVHHCHERGILHRDLKPSNVLVDAFGEPHVTDFGLAKRIDGVGQVASWAAQLTASGQVIGTPGYMSPEQATAKRDVGPAADIYSTGALLYHLLTGRAPFVGDTPTLVLRQVEEQEPVSPRLLNANVAADLETICLKCLAKEPRQRYGTARDLAEDLQRFLGGQPIRARPTGAAERLWRWSLRHPRVASLAALSGVLLLLVIGETVYARARLLEDQRLVRAKDYIADMRLVERAIRDEDLGQATALLEKWDPAPQTERRSRFATSDEDLRGFEWFYFAGLCKGDELFVLGKHQDRALRVAFSPDGKRVASTSWDGEVRLWSVSKRTLLGKGMHGNRAMAVSFSADGRLLASGGDDRCVRLWNGHTLAPSGPPLTQSSALIATAFSPGNANLLFVARQELVSWNLGSHDPARCFRLSPSAWFYGAFSPDGSTLALPMPAATGVRLLQVATGRELGRVGELGVAIAFSPDNRYLATGQLDGKIRIWRAGSWEESLCIPSQAGTVRALAWSPNGRHIASAGRDSALRLWDFPSGQLAATYHGHYGLINGIAFSPDSRRVATASGDTTVRIWDVERPSTAATNLEATKVAFVWRTNAPRADMIYVGFDPEWTNTERASALLDRLSAECRQSHSAMEVTQQGFVLFCADGTLIRFDRMGSRPDGGTKLSPGPVFGPIVSPNGHWAAWKTNTDELSPFGVHELAALDKPDFSWRAGTTWLLPTFTKDEHFLAMVSLEGEIVIWDLERRRQQFRFQLAHGVPTDLAFSPDGRKLAASTADGRVTVWDIKSPRPQSKLLHTDVHSVWCLSFSPDGKRLAAGSDDGEVFLWDLFTQQVASTFRASGSDEIRQVGFSGDGKSLCAASGSATFRWRVLER